MAKKNIVLDALILAKKKDQDFLIQACSKTGGLYLPCPDISKGVVESMLSAFMLTREARADFKLPFLNVGTFYAACHCHQKKIQNGWLCSCCLSIYCKPKTAEDPFCIFCGVKFDPFTVKELSGPPQL